jgi:hypothetical protein
MGRLVILPYECGKKDIERSGLEENKKNKKKTL